MVSDEFETMHLKLVVWVKEASLLIEENVRLFVAFICLRLILSHPRSDHSLFLLLTFEGDEGGKGPRAEREAELQQPDFKLRARG